MKLKYEGTGIEITDKDSKNLISFIEYWLELPDEDKNKLRRLIFGGMGAATYLSIVYLLIRREK